MTDFHKIKTAISEQFTRMSSRGLFRTTADKDAMWATYLNSFPPGSNPIYRKQTKHDCSCCRQFIKTAGNIVTVIDGNVESIWDVTVGDSAYDEVVQKMAALVKASPIDNRFLHTERHIGTDKNREDAMGAVRTYDHFFVNLPRRNDATNMVVSGEQIGPLLAETRAQHDVLMRSLTELTTASVDTVLELIGQNSLYRGAEQKHAVTAFRTVKRAFDALPPDKRDVFVWLQTGILPPSVSKIRNSAIGTLLIDLSGGRDIDGAVSSFESLVAPANYKRPTALVTKAMVDNARKVVADLGLTSALDRRYATLQDVSVNNVLFADRTVKSRMAGSVFDDLATAPAKPRTLDKIEQIPVEKFLSEVVPKATSLEILFENKHTEHLVSLIAPQDPSAPRLFKWDNGFSWSYQGDVADSIKERVKKAGGNVTGDLCCRLSWHNHDDLDLHMLEPRAGHVYFGSKRSRVTGGELDVDMNAGGPRSREPVENIFYTSQSSMLPGHYKLSVNQFAKRENADVGFEVEIDWLGEVHTFSHPRALRPGETVVVANLVYDRAKGLEITSTLSTTVPSKTVWGITTGTFHRVNVLTLSPNHWDGHGVGNKHVFFMLDGCQNDGTARGFYNEFLRSDLDPHRRVFELIGGKLRAEASPNQLSGLGFSTTQRNDVVVRVQGAMSRLLKVTL